MVKELDVRTLASPLEGGAEGRFLGEGVKKALSSSLFRLRFRRLDEPGFFSSELDNVSSSGKKLYGSPRH